jgi:hypothetical protein
MVSFPQKNKHHYGCCTFLSPNLISPYLKFKLSPNGAVITWQDQGRRHGLLFGTSF